MKFHNKAKTLQILKCKNAEIPEFYIINVTNLKNKKKTIIENIIKRFNKSDLLIVRSSSSQEDTHKKSNAGLFKSVANVKNNYDDIDKAAAEVIKSYGKINNSSIIFIQKMITSSDFSGVVTTCNLDDYAPYYVINYSKGEDTSAVTSGKKNVEHYYQFKNHDKGDKKFIKIIKLARELESKFKNKYLDIEFAYKKSELYLLQVRPIVLKKKFLVNNKTFKETLDKLKNKIAKLKKPHPNLYGKTSYYGVMPDWNPAEIIGIKPNQLSISLYQELITDYIWAQNRNLYGFIDMKSFHLMTSFLGTPYIDIRIDFNSWIPKNLSTKIKKKLAYYYLDKFKKNTNLHDKVEFEILFTCFNPLTKSKLEQVDKKYLSKTDKLEIIKELKNINKIAFNKLNQEIKEIDILKKKQNEIIKSNLYSIDKIYWLIEDCKRFGTKPFAGLARCGFIAIELLNSLVEKNFISPKEKEEFIRGINTITTSMIKDSKLSKKKFCEIYGHLRPNTYDILSKNYKENYSFLFRNKSQFNTQKNKKFNLSEISIKKIKKFLNTNFKNISLDDFLNFIKKSIKYREYSKFIFTKNIDLIFQELKFLSKRNNLTLSEISNLDIKIIKDLYYNLDKNTLKDQLTKNIKTNIENSKLHRLIKLPEVIIEPKDIYYFHQKNNIPNFFGTSKVEADIVYLSNKKKSYFNNKIICINSADPGYDFLFNHKIAGLITEYGGANSHMGIRCSELNIPSAIGVGENNFNNIKNSSRIEIDPMTKKIIILK